MLQSFLSSRFLTTQTRSAQHFIGTRWVSLKTVLKMSCLTVLFLVHLRKLLFSGIAQVHNNNSFSVNIHTHSSFITIGQEWRVLYVKTSIPLWYYLFHFFLEWETFQTKFVEKIKTNFFSVTFFFRKSRRFWDNVTFSDIIRTSTGLCLCVFVCDVHKKPKEWTKNLKILPTNTDQ